MWLLRFCTFTRLSWNILAQVFPFGMLSLRTQFPGCENTGPCGEATWRDFSQQSWLCPDFASFKPDLKKPPDNSSAQLSELTPPLPLISVEAPDIVEQR